MIDRKTRSIVHEVKDIITESQDIKAVQPLGGASFVNYNTYSDDSYDLTHTQSALYKAYRVTFTHDIPGNWHILELTAFLRINNPNVMESPQAAGGNYLARITPERPHLGYNSWIFETVNLAGVSANFYVKFYVKGTTSGVLSYHEV